MSLFRHAEFALAAHNMAQLPPEAGGEVAFVGRSNAGKSSAINAILQRKRLAFVSKTPGLTRSINFFRLDGDRFLVDLPGYGYAGVSRAEKEAWGQLVSTYILTRRSLRGVVLVMDVRHPFTKLDRRLLDWIAPLGKPSRVLLTKADKVTRGQAAATLSMAEKAAVGHGDCSVQLFSSNTGVGVTSACVVIADWLSLESPIKNPRLKGSKTGGEKSLNKD